MGFSRGLLGYRLASNKKKEGNKKTEGKRKQKGNRKKSTKIFKKRARESQLTIYTTKAGFQALFSRYINDQLDVVQAYSLEREGGTGDIPWTVQRERSGEDLPEGRLLGRITSCAN